MVGARLLASGASLRGPHASWWVEQEGVPQRSPDYSSCMLVPVRVAIAAKPWPMSFQLGFRYFVAGFLAGSLLAYVAFAALLFVDSETFELQALNVTTLVVASAPGVSLALRRYDSDAMQHVVAAGVAGTAASPLLAIAGVPAVFPAATLAVGASLTGATWLVSVRANKVTSVYLWQAAPWDNKEVTA